LRPPRSEAGSDHGPALCDLGAAALAQATKLFDQRNVDDDPEWIRYFDEAELSAEIGHCFRDLRRPIDAVQHAAQCLALLDATSSPRSKFFAYMVLADAHLSASEIDPACASLIKALKLGEQLRSARCVSYVREFRGLLASASPDSVSSDLEESARMYRLWRPSSNRKS
jgi:hypothetical protein